MQGNNILLNMECVLLSSSRYVRRGQSLDCYPNFVGKIKIRLIGYTLRMEIPNPLSFTNTKQKNGFGLNNP